MLDEAHLRLLKKYDHQMAMAKLLYTTQNIAEVSAQLREELGTPQQRNVSDQERNNFPMPASRSHLKLDEAFMVIRNLSVTLEYSVQN